MQENQWLPDCLKAAFSTPPINYDYQKNKTETRKINKLIIRTCKKFVLTLKHNYVDQNFGKNRLH